MCKESLRPYLWMLLGSFAFACMGAIAYGLGRSCDWQVAALARSSLALLFAACLAGLGGARLVLFQSGTLWVRSIAGSVSLVCTFYALARLPQSHVLTLTGTYPLWVALLSWPLYHERPGLQVWLSVASSVAGVALIQQEDGGEPGELFQLNGAVVSALVASLSTAVAMLGLHRLRNIHPWAIVAHFSGVATVFCLASLLLPGTGPAPRAAPHAAALPLLFGVGVTATVGQLFLTKAFAAGPPAKVSVVGLTQVVFAVGLDVWLWGHTFTTPALVGIGLVLAPTAWLMAGRGESDAPLAA